MAAQSTLRKITDTTKANLPLNTRIQIAYEEWKAANSKAKGSRSQKRLLITMCIRALCDVELLAGCLENKLVRPIKN